MLGRMGGVCEEQTTWTYPHWPSWEPRDEDALHSLKFFKGLPRPKPGQPFPIGIKYKKPKRDEGKRRRGAQYVVEWRQPVEFDNGDKRATMFFSATRYGSEDAARKAAWSYFRHSYPPGKGTKVGTGPLGEVARDGLRYHGGVNHVFTYYPQGKGFGQDLRITFWNPYTDTLDEPKVFCSHHEHISSPKKDTRRFRCLGHHPDEVGGGKTLRPELEPWHYEKSEQNRRDAVELDVGEFQEDDLIVEIGCGTAELSRQFVAKGLSVIPVDKDPTAVRPLVPAYVADVVNSDFQDLIRDVLDLSLIHI